MIVTSIHDWLAEQEHRKNHAIFLLEWLAIFTLAWLFWTCVLFELHVSASSITTAAAISTIYASAFVYIRLYKESACKKCNSPLLFNREEIGRRYVHNEEQCVEIEHGGVEWMEHYIDIYSRLYRVEVIRFRCRRCHTVWEKTEQSPVSDYQLVRTIDLKK